MALWYLYLHLAERSWMKYEPYFYAFKYGRVYITYVWPIDIFFYIWQNIQTWSMAHTTITYLWQNVHKLCLAHWYHYIHLAERSYMKYDPYFYVFNYGRVYITYVWPFDIFIYTWQNIYKWSMVLTTITYLWQNVYKICLAHWYIYLHLAERSWMKYGPYFYVLTMAECA